MAYTAETLAKDTVALEDYIDKKIKEELFTQAVKFEFEFEMKLLYGENPEDWPESWKNQRVQAEWYEKFRESKPK